MKSSCLHNRCEYIDPIFVMKMSQKEETIDSYGCESEATNFGAFIIAYLCS